MRAGLQDENRQRMRAGLQEGLHLQVRDRDHHGSRHPRQVRAGLQDRDLHGMPKVKVPYQATRCVTCCEAHTETCKGTPQSCPLG